MNNHIQLELYCMLETFFLLISLQILCNQLINFFMQIIRQQFPQITTRRLGTRGQSK